MNPFRPCPRRYRMPTSVMPGWVRNTWKKIELAARLPGWSGDKDAARMRWAARRACKRLRAERDEARGLLRSWQDAEVIRRELELDRTPQEIVTAEHNRRVVAEAQLTAAKQENERLREVLQQIENSDAALSNYGLYALVHNALAAGEEKP